MKCALFILAVLLLLLVELSPSAAATRTHHKANGARRAGGGGGSRGWFADCNSPQKYADVGCLEKICDRRGERYRIECRNLCASEPTARTCPQGPPDTDFCTKPRNRFDKACITFTCEKGSRWRRSAECREFCRSSPDAPECS
ncbi:hypothetical protein M3Y99_01042900 [Aphelenchoides fujianensis]|nr:hypothetical protein M3Y99_01042900 [Aphelenchoides fujianensis]